MYDIILPYFVTGKGENRTPVALMNKKAVCDTAAIILAKNSFAAEAQEFKRSRQTERTMWRQR